MNSRNPEIIRVLFTQGKGLAFVKVELVNVDMFHTMAHNSYKL